MARRDLSRTVIEGGRYYWNSWMRRESHRVARTNTRDWLDLVRDEVEAAHASSPPPLERVAKSFRDKLAPAHRWLVSQVGRPWSKVYADLCARFDTRTVAGRHVVRDHVLDWVRRDGEQGRRRPTHYDLVVDNHGILRTPRRSVADDRRRRDATLAWAAGRVCALTYRGWWWFRRLPVGPKCPERQGCAHSQHIQIGTRMYHRDTLVAERALTRGEARRLMRLPDDLRAKLVIRSPWPAR